MAVPQAHWLATHDITTPAHDRSNRHRPMAGVPMVVDRRRNASRLINALVFLVAVWLTVSADPVAYRGTGRFDVFWNHAVVGLAVGAVALVRVAKPTGTGALVLTNSLLGGWLVISPFWYGYGGGTADAGALWNDIAVGGAVLLLTLTTAVLRDRAPDDDEVPPLGNAGGWQLQ